MMSNVNLEGVLKVAKTRRRISNLQKEKEIAPCIDKIREIFIGAKSGKNSQKNLIPHFSPFSFDWLLVAWDIFGSHI